MTEPKAPAPTFTITLEGGDMAPEIVDRIHRALHRAVLSEVAEVDLAPSRTVRFVGIDRFPGGGQTQGLVARIEDSVE